MLSKARIDLATVVWQKYTKPYLRHELPKLGLYVDVPTELISFAILKR